MLRKMLAITSACVTVGLLTAAPASAQFRSDKAVYFTFSEPVALPNTTLPAGKYLFKLMDSQVTRTIVQVFSEDGTKLQATFMSMAAERRDRPNDPEVRFLETAANTPPAIRSWWYPGETRGWEFVYPRAQAMTLAKTSNQPVLTTAEDVSGDAMNSARLTRVNPTGDQTDVTAMTAPEQPTGTALRGTPMPVTTPTPMATEPAPAMAVTTPTPPVSAPAIESPRSSTPVRQVDEMPRSARADLPRTASAGPLVLLVGLVALAGALILRRAPRLN